MTTRTKVIIVIVSLAGAFVLGRYTVPEKIRTEIKTVEIEKKTVDKTVDENKNKHKKTIVKETDKPSGEKVITTEITEDTVSSKDTNSKSTDDTSKVEDNVKIQFTGDKVTISALGGLNLRTGAMVYGASVSRPVLGPLTLGLWGLSDASCGVSVGISF